MLGAYALTLAGIAREDDPDVPDLITSTTAVTSTATGREESNGASL